MMDTIALTADAATLAKLLNASVRSIRTYDQCGAIPAPIRIGGRVLWRVEEIREWVMAGSPDRETWNAIRDRRYH